MADPVQLDGIAPGDLVRISSRGRIFHARVRGTVIGGLEVEPIERGVAQRRVKSSEVVEHWAHVARGRASSIADREQRSFDDLLDR
ncbi:MAG: hypothetical protein H0V81_09060 [Solirubrobacterales bacterium]|nr:hypothetical protein [Solirubrobacterales bacterium]